MWKNKITGIFHANPFKAKLKRDTEGKTNTYAVIKLGSQKKQTPVDSGGKKVFWEMDEIFKFPRKKEKMAFVEVYDVDEIEEDILLGKASIKYILSKHFPPI